MHNKNTVYFYKQNGVYIYNPNLFFIEITLETATIINAIKYIMQSTIPVIANFLFPLYFISIIPRTIPTIALNVGNASKGIFINTTIIPIIEKIPNNTDVIAIFSFPNLTIQTFN